MTIEAKTLEKGFRLVLKTTPEILTPIIRTISSEFKWGDLDYWSVEETKSASPDYRKILIGVRKIAGDSIVCDDCIGVITMLKGGKDKTLFRIPPRGKWYINIAPNALPFPPPHKDISNISNDKFCWFYDESYFSRLLDRLSIEFQQLGFIETPVQKVWRLLKEIKERIPSIRII